jgi:hypothetical protein
VSWYATTHYRLRTSQRSGAVVAIITASATLSCVAICAIRGRPLKAGERPPRPLLLFIAEQIDALPESLRTIGGRASAIVPSARAWQAWPSNKQEALIYKNN